MQHTPQCINNHFLSLSFSYSCFAASVFAYVYVCYCCCVWYLDWVCLLHLFDFSDLLSLKQLGSNLFQKSYVKKVIFTHAIWETFSHLSTSCMRIHIHLASTLKPNAWGKRVKSKIDRKRNGNWYGKRLCLSWKPMAFDLSLVLCVILFHSTQFNSIRFCF